jgi:hypothetical protein
VVGMYAISGVHHRGTEAQRFVLALGEGSGTEVSGWSWVDSQPGRLCHIGAVLGTPPRAPTTEGATGWRRNVGRRPRGFGMPPRAPTVVVRGGLDCAREHHFAD